MLLNEIIRLNEKYYMNTFGNRLPVAFEKGDGIALESTDGEIYYDFTAGYGVSSLGHSYKPLVMAVSNQAKKVIHTSNLFYMENQVKLAKALCDASCFDKVVFLNSGAEANLLAVNLAKKYFAKKGSIKNEIIAFENSYHGKFVTSVNDNLIYAKLNDIDDLKAKITDNTAAVIIELIQGEGGVKPASKEYVEKLREICNNKDIILIVDEVQTGVGRLGTVFGYQSFGIEPDIITLSNGLGGGIPIGAILAKEKFISADFDDENTFGGNPISTAAALCVVSELTQNFVLYRSNRASDYFFDKLNELKGEFSFIKEVRGMGLMIGIEFKEGKGREIAAKLFERKILVSPAGEDVLKLLPPLIVRKDEIDLFVDTLKDILGGL